MQIFDDFIELGTKLAGVFIPILPYSLGPILSHKKQSKECECSSFFVC